MTNYFNYFTEIETRFQQRRGSILMLSTLDWALIETWREAGIPLEAVLRGIDDAFDKHEAQKARAGRRVRKINGLAWAAQAVLTATEAAVDAATGTALVKPAVSDGFEPAPVAAYLLENAAAIEQTQLAPHIVTRLRELASEPHANLEDLDRTLTVLEETLFGTVLAGTSEAELLDLREQAARELAPYKGRMQPAQMKQVQQQFLQKRLLEERGLPRLSLFYMRHG